MQTCPEFYLQLSPVIDIKSEICHSLLSMLKRFTNIRLLAYLPKMLTERRRLMLDLLEVDRNTPDEAITRFLDIAREILR